MFLWPKVPKLFASKPLVPPKLSAPNLCCPIVCFFLAQAFAVSYAVLPGQAAFLLLLLVVLFACKLLSCKLSRGLLVLPLLRVSLCKLFSSLQARS